MLEFFVKLPPCVIGVEACGSAHYWARKLIAIRHAVKLMAPQFVKPYVKTNKNDTADVEAICEAVVRPTMRFVLIKTDEQQAVLSLHRVRQGFVKSRTAQTNQIRGLLSEFGVIIPAGMRQHFRRGGALHCTSGLARRPRSSQSTGSTSPCACGAAKSRSGRRFGWRSPQWPAAPYRLRDPWRHL